jgi:hypothetical protein
VGSASDAAPYKTSGGARPARPQATLEPLGGDGFQAVYPWYADQQLLATANVIERYGRLRAAVLVLYAQGWLIATEKLRAAALAEFADRERRYRKASLGDPAAAASVGAFTEKRKPRGQRWRSRHPGGTRDPDSYDALVSAFAGGFSILTADAGDPQDRDQFVELSGLAATVDQLRPNPDGTRADPAEIEELIHVVQIPAIRRGLAAASSGDFDDAQRISRSLRERLSSTPLAAELAESELDYALNVLGIAALLTVEPLGTFLRNQTDHYPPARGPSPP